jgi:hypothetical protein
MAAVLAEQGRAVLWNGMLDLRRDLTEVAGRWPELAARMVGVRRQIDDSTERVGHAGEPIRHIRSELAVGGKAPSSSSFSDGSLPLVMGPAARDLKGRAALSSLRTTLTTAPRRCDGGVRWRGGR